MNKILKALKFVWKNNKLWLIITASVLVIVFAATMVATQNVFLRNTISTVMGAERRVLASGDPSKYLYYATAKDGKNGFKYFDSSLDLNDKYNKNNAKYDKTAKAAALAEANKLNELIAEEGIVLLKNDMLSGGTARALPLETSAANKTKISVFGKNSTNLVYGGAGSGGADATKAKTLYESLAEANYDVNPILKGFYENKSQSGTGRGKEPQMNTIPAGFATGETPRSRYTSDVKSSYAEYNAAALVVISRIGGEGFDLPRTMKTTTDGSTPVTGAANADDHYLQLDRDEKNMLEDVCKDFNKVILIINCSTSMELGFLDDGTYDIDAALWIGSPGATGIMALGRILNGSANPSGRLVDTYARNFKLDPTWYNFADNRKTDGNRYKLTGAGADAYFVEYEESIYMGYRYYETRGYIDTLFGDGKWYDDNVVFPFGYGLSYTSFSWEIVEDKSFPAGGSILTKEGEISITVRVKNTGTRPGMDVVQMYYGSQYRNGEVEKSHVVLGAYEKTKELVPVSQNPNAYEDVMLTIKVPDMASYDYSDANNNGFKGYELDRGSVSIYIGRNAHQAWMESGLTRSYTVPTNATRTGFMYPEDTETGKEVVNRYDDVSSHFLGPDAKGTLLSRRNYDFEGTMPAAPTDSERNTTQAFIDSLQYTVNDKPDDPWYTKAEDMPRQGWKPGKGETAYKLYDVIQRDPVTGEVTVDYNDDIKWNNILDQLTVSEMAYMIGTGNFNSARLDSIGKPAVLDTDGPVGFTNFMDRSTYYDTCFYASECVIAATWNKLLAHDMGVMVGIEGLIGNVRGDGRPYSGWYAPAVNLHRSPFSGRNFEYYSEDPYLSGMTGANVVKGAKSKGVYTYIKHFAVNDQETNRVSNGLITWATEQTMREIYFKPFEIIVKEGQTTGMMSSFNRLGTVWAGGDYRLLTEILRNEWGFKGTVISDYNLYPYMPADQMIRAGGDLNLTQNSQPSTGTSDLTATQVAAIRQATKNVLYTVAQSNAMNGMGQTVVWRYAMPIWQILLILANVALVIGLGAWGFFAVRKTYKKEKAKKIN